MAAGPWVMPNATRAKLLNGTIDVHGDVFKIALILAAENLTEADALYTDLTEEHASEHGYLQDTKEVDLVVSGTTTVKGDIASDPVWTANGGSILARWAVIYKDTGDQDILCFCLLDDTPGDVEATDGNTLTVAAHASGVLTLT